MKIIILISLVAFALAEASSDSEPGATPEAVSSLKKLLKNFAGYGYNRPEHYSKRSAEADPDPEAEAEAEAQPEAEAEALPEADPTLLLLKKKLFKKFPKSYYGYGYNRPAHYWKRSADADPEAEAEAEDDRRVLGRDSP